MVRRALVAFVVESVIGLVVWALVVDADTVEVHAGSSTSNASTSNATQAGAEAGTAASTTTTVAVSVAPADGRTASQRRLTKVTTISDGPLKPKSVVATGDGRFLAQNMMYEHSVTVYNRDFSLVKRVDDSIDPTKFGITDTTGTLKGAPVEAAISPDGSTAWISNYQMYGTGFDRPGDDKCSKADWDSSFLYRLDLASLEISAAIRVGPVPKYVAATPDGTTVLVTNWCGYDMSVVDTATSTETRRIPLGRFPRGIAISPNSRTAYVAIMGSSDIAVVDLKSSEVSWIRDVGRGPRHLVLSPDGATLYATLNSAGRVARIDTATRRLVDSVASPEAPRSMAISDDGSALYVVNYESDQVSKIDTSTMSEVQRIDVAHHPIGITYDAATRQVWVACYVGRLEVLQDA